MAKKLFLLLAVGLIAFAGVGYAKKISKKEAEAQMAACNTRKTSAEDAINGMEPKANGLKSEISALDAKIAELEARLAELQKQPKYWGRYTVKSGDYLYKIADDPFVYHDGSKWPMIYEANNDIIKDPNLIYPGWVLFIPGLNEWKVISGDCLWKIANSVAVYGNASKWPQIYEANKDQIRDPDLIYPNQVFKIPR